MPASSRSDAVGADSPGGRLCLQSSVSSPRCSRVCWKRWSADPDAAVWQIARADNQAHQTNQIGQGIAGSSGGRARSESCAPAAANGAGYRLHHQHGVEVMEPASIPAVNPISPAKPAHPVLTISSAPADHHQRQHQIMYCRRGRKSQKFGPCFTPTQNKQHKT